MPLTMDKRVHPAVPITLPDLRVEESEMGEAMQSLTPLQRNFVTALLLQGDINYGAAARAAGYNCSSDNSARVVGHNLAHNPRILAAMHEEAQRRMEAATLMSVSRLVEIAANATDQKIALKAIGMVLNRAGLHEKSEHKVTVHRTGNDADVVRRITELANKLGLDPKVMLGQAGYVDAEFKEVAEPEPEEEVW